MNITCHSKNDMLMSSLNQSINQSIISQSINRSFSIFLMHFWYLIVNLYELGLCTRIKAKKKKQSREKIVYYICLMLVFTHYYNVHGHVYLAISKTITFSLNNCNKVISKLVKRVIFLLISLTLTITANHC